MLETNWRQTVRQNIEWKWIGAIRYTQHGKAGVINGDGKIVMMALLLFYDDWRHPHDHTLNGMMI